MATGFPIPSAEQVGLRPPSVLKQPLLILRGAMGAAIHALLDLCCITIACIAGILLYELYRPLNLRDAWFLCAELSLKYGLAFVILAQAHHLYTQRATLLQVADTARILRISVYGLTLLSVGNYFTKANMPRLLLTYFWAFSTLLLIVQKYSTSRIICDWNSFAAHQRQVNFTNKFQSQIILLNNISQSQKHKKHPKITQTQHINLNKINNKTTKYQTINKNTKKTYHISYPKQNNTLKIKIININKNHKHQYIHKKKSQQNPTHTTLQIYSPQPITSILSAPPCSR